IAIALFGGLALAAGAATSVGFRPPWWVALPLVAGLFLALTVPAWRVLRAHPREADPGVGQGALRAEGALDRPARISTAVLGLALGGFIVAGANGWQEAVGMSMVAILFGAIMAARSPYGLPRLGSLWGPAQWLAFALAASACLLTALIWAGHPGSATGEGGF
ncbi:hypothetical protein, partial [Leucobacter sp. M11]|uniref:hypothetical protein n=1 Tax=Leucobacter sp. M11 TaxID=2993565 RepID=UPI002D80C10F